MQKLKLPEDNIGENLDDSVYGGAFLDTTLKTWSMKEVIYELDLIKLKMSVMWKTIPAEWTD